LWFQGGGRSLPSPAPMPGNRHGRDIGSSIVATRQWNSKRPSASCRAAHEHSHSARLARLCLRATLRLQLPLLPGCRTPLEAEVSKAQEQSTRKRQHAPPPRLAGQRTPRKRGTLERRVAELLRAMSFQDLPGAAARHSLSSPSLTKRKQMNTTTSQAI
jgi:hypothetical protein